MEQQGMIMFALLIICWFMFCYVCFLGGWHLARMSHLIFIRRKINSFEKALNEQYGTEN